MSVKKKVNKTFTKVTKGMGFNALERRKLKKTAKQFTYDVAVESASELVVMGTCCAARYAWNFATAGVRVAKDAWTNAVIAAEVNAEISSGEDD
jgi:hypothetical protein